MILHSTLHFSVTSDDLPSSAWCVYCHSSGTPYLSPEWLLTSGSPTPAHPSCQQYSPDNASWSLSLLLPTSCFSPPTAFLYLLVTLATQNFMPFPKILFGSKLYSLTIHNSFAILPKCPLFPFAQLASSHKAFKTKPKLHLISRSLSGKPHGWPS